MADRSKSRLEESGLLTSDPHHLPGYGGFCPQFKYRYGKTFGQMTSTLLTDEEIDRSGNTVLAEVVPDTTRSDQIENARSDLVENREFSVGDQKFGAGMIPGYSGFVPKSQHYFGTRYANICRNSAADLELDLRKMDYNKSELKLLEAIQEGRVEAPADQLPAYLSLSPRPLRAVAEKAQPYHSGEKINATISPYNLANQDSNKNFKSGYTGFVPRARGLLGQGYPIISNKGLTRFTEDTNKQLRTRHEPVMLQASMTPPPTGKEVYPFDSGLVPKYTGHVPGVRFGHGKTFGKSTVAAKQVLPDVSS